MTSSKQTIMAELGGQQRDSCKAKNAKRQGYLEWDDYFMSVAFLSAQRSKDPRTQVGACIVNQEDRIVGIGYNGMPRGCSDDEFPWTSPSSSNQQTPSDEDDLLNDKNLYVCHAELNAILNKNSADVHNCKIYVALFPCNECAKVVIQSGIKEVIYYSDKYHDKPKFKASRKMLQAAKVHCRQFSPEQKQIVIDFESVNRYNRNNNENIDDNVTPTVSSCTDGLGVKLSAVKISGKM